MSSNGNQRRFNIAFQAAKTAEEEGELRVAADKYLEATLSAPSKWAEDRYRCFLEYARIIQDPSRIIQATEEEKRTLKRISKDKEEPILFRVRALFARAILVMFDDEFDDAALYFRRAIALSPKVSSSERSRQVKVPAGGADFMISVGDELDAIAKHANENLEAFEDEDPESVPEDILKTVPKVNGVPDPDIVRRLAVGGGKCDCCGKSRTEVDEMLSRCVRCKRAYYCSEACQHKQWGAGHKKACREPGKFKPGDYMTLKGIVAKPELNSKVVRVVRPVSGGRWAVSMEGRDGTMSIAAEKLVHIRPAK